MSPLDVCDALHEQKVRLTNLAVYHTVQHDGRVWVALQVGTVVCLRSHLNFRSMHAHISLFTSDKGLHKLAEALGDLSRAVGRRHPADFHAVLFLFIGIWREIITPGATSRCTLLLTPRYSS